MKSKMIIICAILIASTFVTLGQSTNFTIKIDAKPFSLKTYNIEINKSNNTIKIKYNMVDSISKIIGNDSIEILAILNEISNQDSSTEKRKELRKKLEFLMLKHTFFKSDSIVFDICNNKDYSSLFDSVYNLKEEDLNVEKRMVLDGIHYTIYIRQDNKLLRELHVHCPDKIHNPLIYQLINESNKLKPLHSIR